MKNQLWECPVPWPDLLNRSKWQWLLFSIPLYLLFLLFFLSPNKQLIRFQGRLSFHFPEMKLLFLLPVVLDSYFYLSGGFRFLSFPDQNEICNIHSNRYQAYLNDGFLTT